jgi:hypothetical protein
VVSEETYNRQYKNIATLTGRSIQGQIEAVLGQPSAVNTFLEMCRRNR